jgi:hypothetical protein
MHSLTSASRAAMILALASSTGIGCARGLVSDASTGDPISGANVDVWRIQDDADLEGPFPSFAYSTGATTASTTTTPYELWGSNYGFDPSSGPVYGPIDSTYLGEGLFRYRVSKAGYETGVFYRSSTWNDSTCWTHDGASWKKTACTTEDFQLWPSGATHDLLPDITADPVDLEDNEIECVQMSGPDIRALRLSVGTPNVGEGPLVLNQYSVGAGGTVQTIYRSNGSTYDVTVEGELADHELHEHIHYDDWTQMRLISDSPACLDIEERDPSCVLAESEKVTFCIMDTDMVDAEINNAWAARGLVPDAGAMFTDGWTVCDSTEQGLTPGRKDVYTKNLPGQFIDITGIGAGDYLIEVQVDPDGQVVESNTSNNVARVPISLDATSCDSTLNCSSGSSYGCAEYFVD